jgi:hypothetical protein
MAEYMTATYETVYTLALQLSPTDRARLIAQLAPTLIEEAVPEKTPKRSLRGALADLNLDVSREDIDEIRRDMWADFPREDIA